MGGYVSRHYNTGELGDMELNYINSTLIRLPNPTWNHLRFQGEKEVRRLYIPMPFFDELVSLEFPIADYPSEEVYEHWENKKTANIKDVDSPEIEIDVEGTDFKATYLNTRILRFYDTHEANHVEIVKDRETIGFEASRVLLRKLFWEDFPQKITWLPLDESSRKWYESHDRVA